MNSIIMRYTKTGMILLILFSALTGLIYPLVVTVLAQWVFPYQANGSLIEQEGHRMGSQLIGQSFTDPRYFWSRPSATTPYPYNAASSSGSNWGPTNADYLKAVQERVEGLHRADPKNALLIPVDLVTASGSGLDPDISPTAAFYQVSRIAKVRHLPEQQIQAIIISLIQKRTLSLLGEPRINVVQLNLALDNVKNNARTAHGRTSPNP